jgi:signal transduction histidine kinase
VRIDSGRILQVLGNLVSNAIKFSPDGGRISLLVERAGPEIQF